MERTAGTPQHQNVVAVCTPKAYDDISDLVAQVERPLLVALDGVEDPANLGAIIRTVVATGARGVVIPERRAAGLSPAVARAAAGALEHAKVARVPNLVRALMDLKSQNLWVYGFEAEAPKSYTELDYSQGCVLVLGGEGRGLHRLVREACDERAHIPLRGPVSSLNVSVAAGVVLYEAVRQRGSVGAGLVPALRAGTADARAPTRDAPSDPESALQPESTGGHPTGRDLWEVVHELEMAALLLYAGQRPSRCWWCSPAWRWHRPRGRRKTLRSRALRKPPRKRMPPIKRKEPAPLRSSPSNVQNVTTPVTVFDSSGQFVYDLEKDEFKVYDNGELQDIKGLTPRCAAVFGDRGRNE